MPTIYITRLASFGPDTRQGHQTPLILVHRPLSCLTVHMVASQDKLSSGSFAIPAHQATGARQHQDEYMAPRQVRLQGRKQLLESD